MKKIYFLIIVFCLFTSVNAQIINFPDANFKARLITADVNTGTVTNFSGNFFKLDVNYDGEIQLSEALLVKEMNIGDHNGSSMYTNMTGIQNFENLQSLKCGGGNPIQNLDVSNLIELKELRCSGTQMTSLDLSNLIHLEKLDYGNNPQLTNLIINSSNIIHTVKCEFNNLTSINLSIFPNLKSLDCSYNQLTNVDLSSFPNFENLNCSNNLLTSLNINGLTNLKVLECGYNFQLPLINFSTFPNLQKIDCSFNSLQNSINVLGLSQLTILFCNGLNLLNLDLSSNSQLVILTCSNNQLTTLELNHLINLKYFSCDNNSLYSIFIKGMNFEVNGIYDAFFGNNPNLNYICVNENMTGYFQYKINEYNYTNCNVSSTCALSTEYFNEFSTYFELYPNPVSDILNISTKQNIDISSINIYNTLGQLVLTIPNAKNAKSVDVSSLKSGNYFVKINSDKGSSNTKFIKN